MKTLIDVLEKQRWSEKDHLVITKFDYLKTPMFSWSFKNRLGGSFSNSGMHRSLKSCVAHVHANTHVSNNWDLPVLLITVHGFDDQENPVETTQETYLGKLKGFKL